MLASGELNPAQADKLDIVLPVPEAEALFQVPLGQVEEPGCVRGSGGFGRRFDCLAGNGSGKLFLVGLSVGVDEDGRELEEAFVAVFKADTLADYEDEEVTALTGEAGFLDVADGSEAAEVVGAGVGEGSVNKRMADGQELASLRLMASSRSKVASR